MIGSVATATLDEVLLSLLRCSLLYLCKVTVKVAFRHKVSARRLKGLFQIHCRAGVIGPTTITACPNDIRSPGLSCIAIDRSGLTHRTHATTGLVGGISSTRKTRRHHLTNAGGSLVGIQGAVVHSTQVRIRLSIETARARRPTTSTTGAAARCSAGSFSAGSGCASTPFVFACLDNPAHDSGDRHQVMVNRLHHVGLD